MSAHEDIFLNARQIADAEERAAFLDRMCAGDTVRRAAVEQMLRDAHQADAFFQTNERPSSPRPETEVAGAMIGRYKLLEKIGEGGMGVVFMAQQREPVVRKVALKIIKAGMDTRQVVARFEAERQALALMDHPNIAKVLDGGETETGRPYFVMDLVQGLPITQFCDEAKLSTRERLELFLEVCSAIQHAHQKGIIHRDIKPSNILVTLHGDKPVPKVIDFGIAKATQQPLTDKTLFTQFQHFLGTPAYMSPEQASLSGLDIDTRSDIYALGVLLYELLTGTTPFDGKELLKSGLDEMRRTIREKEPPRPSTKVSSLAGSELTTTVMRRGLDASNFIRLLRGDLDWIVMKAIEKDRARRYETANAFAADIQRLLSDEPVMARPPTASYRIAKFIRRNRLITLTSGIVATALLTGSGICGWLYLRERAARKQATTAEANASLEQRRSARTAQFLSGMFTTIGREVAEGRDRDTLIKLVDKAAGEAHTRLSAEPEVQAEVLSMIGHSYYDLGEFGRAEAMLAKAVIALEAQRGAKHPVVLAAMNELALALRHNGNQVQSEGLTRKVLAVKKDLYGPMHEKIRSTLTQLGSVLRDQGKYAEAEQCYREVLAINEKLSATNDTAFAWLLNSLALTMYGQGKLAAAESNAITARRIRERHHGEEHPNVAQSLTTVALTVGGQGRYAEADELHMRAVSMSKKFFGAQHPNTLAATTDWAGLLADWAWAANEDANALSCAQKAEALLRDLLSAQRNGRAIAWRNALVQVRLGSAIAAGALLDQSFDASARAERFREAEALLLQGNESFQAVPAETRYKTEAMESFVRFYEAWQRIEPASEKERAAAQWRERLLPFRQTSLDR